MYTLVMDVSLLL